MTYIAQIISMMLLLTTSLSVAAQTQPHPGCVVDPEMAMLQLPPCALEKRAGQDFVAQPYLRLFDFSVTPHLASSSTPDMGWIYFNRQGRIVVRNVAPMDNGASEFHYGLVRVVTGEKWGLANTRGTLVVPLQYDGILDYFSGEGWKACTGCRTVIEGEHSIFQGGRWISLDRFGHILHRTGNGHS